MADPVSVPKLVNLHVPITIKYLIVSIVATTVDFVSFYLLGNLMLPMLKDASFAMLSAFLGAFTAWILHRSWVFEGSGVLKRKIRIRYFLGVVTGIALNGFLVGLFSDVMELERMASRVVSSILVWALGYLFNRRVVFKM